MKNIKGLIVSVLCVCMVFSVFIPAMSAEKNWLETEDFSYSEKDGHFAKWTDVANGSGTAEASYVKNGGLAPAVTGSAGNTSTVVKDNWWKQSGVKTFETDVTFTYSNSNMASVTLYSDENGSSFGVQLYCWENAMYIRGFATGNIDNNKSWRYGPNKQLDYGSDTKGTFHFKAEYDYSKLSSESPYIDVTLIITSDKMPAPNVLDTYIAIVPKDGYSLKENFKAGIGSANRDGIAAADNIEYTFRLSDDETAEEYINKYTAVSEKSADTLSGEDIKLLTAAMSEFDKFNANTKVLARAVYGKLYKLFKEKYAFDEVSDDFSDPDKSEALWKSETVDAKTVITQENAYENGVFTPARVKYGTPPAAVTLRNGVTNSKLPQSVSFTMNLNKVVDSVTDNPHIYAISSQQYGSVPASKLGFRYLNYNGTLYIFRIMDRKNGVEDNDLGGPAYSCAMPQDGKMDVSIKYDYSHYEQSRIIIIIGEFTVSGKTTDIKTVYQLKNYENESITTKQFAFGSASGNSDVTIDNFKMTLLSNKITEAKCFENEHSLILSGSTFTNDELSEYETAFNALSAGARSVLANIGHFDKAVSFFGFSSDSTSDAFKTKYSAEISKEIADITNNDIATYANIIGEYDQLTFAQKMVLNREFAALAQRLNAANAYEIPRNDYDKSPIVYDFEDGKGFSNVREENYGYEEITIDPINGGDNHVWHTSELKNSVFLITDAQWPKYCQPTTVSFDLYLPDGNNIFTPFAFVASYIDDENYTTVHLDKGVCHFKKYTDGVSQGNAIWQGAEIDYSGWLHFSVAYSAGGDAIVTVIDKNDTTVSGKINYNLGGKLGFKGRSAYNNFTKDAYVDNFRVEFTDGDFDVNNEVGKISVYYEGNTFLEPDDSVTVSGEKLAKTVDSAKIYRLSDDNSGLGYILQENYNTPAMLNYDAATVKEPTFDDAAAQDLPILQKSDLSINVTVPKDMSKGVYAVKLKNKIYGYEDKIIYLNLPRVRSIQGDEGKYTVSGGYLRIIGNNLGVNAPTVKLKNKTTGDIITVESANIEIQDDYSIKAHLPELNLGKYDVYVHNGYGDSSAYSTPYEIEVIKPIRDSWPTAVFNVKAFGAVGNGYTNDTPAFLAALNAAAENGGGTVYVPTGDYRMVAELAIPSNVRLIGDGSDKTVILWTARRWDTYCLPEGNINILGNTEIKGIYFAGSRMASAMRIENASREKNSNIYISDVQFFSSFAIGSASSAGGGLIGITVEEAYALNLAETSKKVFYNFDNGKKINDSGTNIHVTNVTTDVFNRKCEVFFGTNYSYAQYDKFDMGNGGGVSGFGGTDVIFENSEMANTCVGPNANHLYFARNTYGPQYNNNREIMTTDGGPWAMKKSIQFVGDKPEICGAENAGDTTFKFTDMTPDDGTYVGYSVFVTNGQGVGQARTIVWQKGNLFKVDRPFEVNPNRNSEINFGRTRIGMYFIQNTWRSGAACGTYGAMVDSVFDGNKHIEHQGQIFNNHEGPVWYISNINGRYEQKTYIHGEVVGGFYEMDYDNLYIIEYITGGSETYGNIAIAFRDNYLDGYSFGLWNCTSINAVEGVIYENNTVTDVTDKVGLNITVGDNNGNNIMIRNNDFECDKGYYVKYLEGKLNKHGSPKLYVEQTAVDPALGDINLDGRVSLKDITLIKMYVMGQVQLTDEQLSHGDVNEDGKVDLKDANQIRKFILSGENYTKINTWMPGVW